MLVCLPKKHQQQIRFGKGKEGKIQEEQHPVDSKEKENLDKRKKRTTQVKQEKIKTKTESTYLE